MGSYLRLELVRIVRDRRYLVFCLALPLVYYLLFTSLGSTTGRSQGLRGDVEFMVAMAALGAAGAALFSGAAVVHDRAAGWLRFLAATPLPVGRAVLGRVAAGMAVALPGVGAVCLAAAIAHGVGLEPWQWIALIALLWLAVAPFGALGLLIGFLSTPQSVQPTTVLCWLALSLLGGLWIPLSSLSATMRNIARLLPGEHYVDLGWRIAAGHAPTAADALVLVCWTLAIGGLTVAAYRHAAITR